MLTPWGWYDVENRNQDFLLAQYVNDRPFVASSFLSVAIAQVLGSAMGGRCNERPELATTPIPLVARIEVLPGEGFLHGIFKPLGYSVEAVRHSLDEQFPESGRSPSLRDDYGGEAALGTADAFVRARAGLRRHQALFRRR